MTEFELLLNKFDERMRLDAQLIADLNAELEQYKDELRRVASERDAALEVSKSRAERLNELEK